MSNGYANKVVGQIGEFLLCAEVARHCKCIATPFSGNVPNFDVIATDDLCRSVPIQVKTANGGDWKFDVAKFVNIEFDEEKELQLHGDLIPLRTPNLIYAFIWLGHEKKSSDRFFFCTMKVLQEMIREENAAFLEKHNGHRPRNWKSTLCAVRIPYLESYENNWKLIDSQLDNLPLPSGMEKGEA